MLNCLVYTPKTSKRLKYIFNLIFKDILNINISITNSEEEFLSFEGLKITYSNEKLNDELFFNCSKLLFENTIQEQNLRIFNLDGEKAFFPVYDKNSALPFDPFAASFFLVSRYEEYLPYMKDKYGRFDAQESIAYKNHFIHKPLVNIWAHQILNLLKEKYPQITFKINPYKYIPTIDIDLFYAYRLKGFLRTTAGYLKSLYEADFKGITERTKVLAGIIKDPFDTYELQQHLHKKYNLHPIYFILVADYAQYDKNIPYHTRQFHSIIKSLGDYAELGIHPSFASNQNPKLLKEEISRLSNILNKDITKSRQHFLKLHFPNTYRNLIDNDIQDDYTMGYAGEIGFRASICSSFNFFDLDRDAETNLRIHPFAIMEATLKDYQNLSNPDVLEYVKPVIEQVKKVDGTLITLWHNESLSNQKRWKGWHNIYEDIIKISV